MTRLLLALALAATAAPAHAQQPRPAAPRAAQTEPRPVSQSINAAPDPAVTAKLAEYDTTRSPVTLKEAGDAAALHDGETPPDPNLAPAAARARVASWVAIMARIKRDLPAEFDPARQPVLKIAPPGPDGRKYPPGIPPDQVKEPALRAAYIEAIRRNEDVVKNYTRYYKLYEADEVIRRRAVESLVDARQTLGLSAQQARPVLEGADLIPADREALLKALQA